MAGLILKSPYLKCGGKEKVSGYLRYIATREHVQKLTDSPLQKCGCDYLTHPHSRHSYK